MQKKNFFVSIDTRKSFVLKKSLKLKINMLNDVSGLSFDNRMIKIE